MVCARAGRRHECRSDIHRRQRSRCLFRHHRCRADGCTARQPQQFHGHPLAGVGVRQRTDDAAVRPGQTHADQHADAGLACRPGLHGQPRRRRRLQSAGGGLQLPSWHLPAGAHQRWRVAEHCRCRLGGQPVHRPGPRSANRTVVDLRGAGHQQVDRPGPERGQYVHGLRPVGLQRDREEPHFGPHHGAGQCAGGYAAAGADHAG